MKGELYINSVDAYTAWGVSMDGTSISNLMTPPSLKSYIESESRTEHGKRYVTDSTMYVDSRDITLQLNLTASSSSEFYSRYSLFCAELMKGVLDIKTSYTGSTIYHCVYVSCSQFSEFSMGIGKFVLKLTEYNPNVRS